MAPEIIRGKDLLKSPEIDVWSIGVLTFQLYYGFLPFDNQSISGIKKNIIE